MKLAINQQLHTTLSSNTAVYKTQRFLNITQGFTSIDLFLSKLGQALIENDFVTKKGNLGNCPCYVLNVADAKFYFIVQANDIVFVYYENKDAYIRRGDTRYMDALRRGEHEASIVIAKELPVPESDIKKLYRTCGSDFVQFPMLDDTQSKILTTEDENMLVQGVAGSGKTNLCIDKIIYSAARGYMGRILYSTFSRGLLSDTRLRVTEFNKQIKELIKGFNEGKIKVFGGNITAAIEKRLGLKLNVPSEKAIDKLTQISQYLDSSVDYMLIEDLYKSTLGGEVLTADETYFIKTYIPSIKNHQLTSRLSKIHYLSYEVIYKEIFGLIMGASDINQPLKPLGLADYTNIRQNSFNKEECEVIYYLASDYASYLSKNNITDNNLLSRELLEVAADLEKYSLIVLDEVQDFTQISLVLFKNLAYKLFCVGDALQMINASFFSFSYLKRLLYEKDLSSTAELVSNYRNTKKIADIGTSLASLNAKWFGTHSFVLTPKALDSYSKSEAVHIGSGEFLKELSKNAFNNYTIVVASQKEKEELRSRFPRPEILTVSEIKGLERDTIILHRLTSVNHSRFKNLERSNINRKTADENSVYRYYFNLLYVGISRARQKLYVYEDEHISIFSDFYKQNFDALSTNSAVANLLQDADKLEAEQDEIIERVRQFIALGQYDNARFSAKSILLFSEKQAQLNRIDVAEEFISKGLHREAGIKFLQLALYLDAKEQFILASDSVLEGLAQSCLGSNSSLGLEVLNSFMQLKDNADVRRIILGLIKNDFDTIKQSCSVTSAGLKKIRN